MARKFRSAESYLGNTAEARRRQRSNLVPGNIYRKMQVSELRFDCFFEVMPLENEQEIYENHKNKRGLEDTPKKELKDKEFLNTWWVGQDFEEKEFIYKNDIVGYDKKTRSMIFNDMEKCLKKKLALLEKG